MRPAGWRQGLDGRQRRGGNRDELQACVEVLVTSSKATSSPEPAAADPVLSIKNLVRNGSGRDQHLITRSQHAAHPLLNHELRI